MADEKKATEKRIVSVFIHEDYKHAFQASELKGDERYTFEFMRDYGHVRITDKKAEKCKSLPLSALTITWG